MVADAQSYCKTWESSRYWILLHAFSFITLSRSRSLHFSSISPTSAVGYSTYSKWIVSSLLLLSFDWDTIVLFVHLYRQIWHLVWVIATFCFVDLYWFFCLNVSYWNCQTHFVSFTLNVLHMILCCFRNYQLRVYVVLELSDGVAIAEALTQIAPEYFSPSWYSKVKTDVGNNWRLKVSNLKKILEGVVGMWKINRNRTSLN